MRLNNTVIHNAKIVSVYMRDYRRKPLINNCLDFVLNAEVSIYHDN